jgi:hypothetical protein
MTEAEWLACTDPEPMLRFLMPRGVSDRKLRLFAAACCRRIWPLLTHPDSRHVVEVSERFADGRAGPRELAEALALAVARGEGAAQAAYYAGSRNPSQSVEIVSSLASVAVAESATHEARAAAGAEPAAWRQVVAAEARARAAEAAEQAVLLRDIAGNPFRPVNVDHSWREWHGGTVARMARAISDERRFDDLPVLADALEEAGCGNPELLRHCRQPGTHVPGCWVVDALLGRE